MLFKLSIRNMKKSFKDYAIYFLTLVLGVAIFYMFNSLDSQQAMLDVTNSQYAIIELMISMLSYISVFVAVILGLLIVYANNFLINRRKKEFGIYMLLGMGKRQISKIILFETILAGILSLVVGLVVGIFASQFMSILVAKLFEANMTKFEFVFSKQACIKTCIYFAVMYLAVMLFNTFTISKYKLINLLTAVKKNETVKIKNPFISILIFLISCVVLGVAYYNVTTTDVNAIDSEVKLLIQILMGVVGTVGIFWSLSGFLLRVIQGMKKTYLSGTNMFVLRQLNNKINTTVVSMSVICLMLFMTISILSASLSLRESMQKEMLETTPVDLNLYKTSNLPEQTTTKSGKVIKYTKKQQEDSRESIVYTLTQNGFDMNNLKDVVEIPIYTAEQTWYDSFGILYEEKYSYLLYDTKEEIIKVSDYNKIAKLYGLKEYSLNDNEYMVICEYSNMLTMRNTAFSSGYNTIKVNGKTYTNKYNECKEGFVIISSSHTNMGIILVPDSCDLKDAQKEKVFLVGNYNVETKAEREELEEKIFGSNDSALVQNLTNKGIELNAITKISIIDSSVGLTTIIIFIAIYLGIIFLIASSAILALKQLTESSDNKQRYIILRKIGCDEKMINSALFKQIGIFFTLPLILAVIHSIFGIKFALIILSSITNTNELISSIIATAIIIGVIYGIYFLTTYYGSKNIIKEEEQNR